MVKTLILISLCESIEEKRPIESVYGFHFKGVCLGHEIRKIHLKSADSIEVGSEYLIYAKISGVEKNILTGRTVKVRKLDSMRVEL